MELLERSEESQQTTGQTLPQQQKQHADAPAEAVAAVSAEPAEPIEAAAIEETETPALDKDGVIAALEAMSRLDDTGIDADEAARLKRIFYTIEHEQQRQAFQEYIDGGGAAEDYVATADPREQRLKELLAIVKEKKARERERLEARLLANSERKHAIVAELESLSADTDNINRHYQRAKELQSEFKAIGDVPQEQATALWKSFTAAVERFYDQWKVNKELRDYDFKKNLGEKQLILAEAVALADEPDVITAFKRLQDLHQKWRETGPVAKELRDDLWNSFRDASANVSKRYQAHFEERKARERANEEAKTALCEAVESIDWSQAKTFNDWNALTAKIMEIQTEWKKLGQAPRKSNNALYARFRQTCDKFFAAKAQYFKSVKDSLTDNLALKTALCEKAEALKDSTEWRSTTDKIVELQKEWRAIGAVPKKVSDQIWRRFMDACDYFFEQKKKQTSATRRTENANLRTKRDIISKLTDLNSPDSTTERQDAIASIQELRQLWQSTGHVPFKEKDNLANTYRELVGQLYDKYDIRENRARMASFESNIDKITDDNRLVRERERMLRAYEQRRNELKTYENNLGFLNFKSRSGEEMLRQMNSKMQRIKDDLAEIEKKIAIIDAKL